MDIQIKARSRNAQQAATFAAMEIRNARENFFFLFYSEACDTYWVMPSLDVVRLAYCNKEGKNAGKFSLTFCNMNVAGRWNPRPKWSQYENAFDLISKAAAASPPSPIKGREIDAAVPNR